jgi:hypothetical protein
MDEGCARCTSKGVVTVRRLFLFFKCDAAMLQHLGSLKDLKERPPHGRRMCKMQKQRCRHARRLIFNTRHSNPAASWMLERLEGEA